MDGFRIAGLNYPYQPDGWLPADQNGSFTNKHLETSNSMGAVLHRLDPPMGHGICRMWGSTAQISRFLKESTGCRGDWCTQRKLWTSVILIYINIYIYINICIVFSMLRPHGEILYAWGTAIFWVSCYIVASFGCQANMAAEHSHRTQGIPPLPVGIPIAFGVGKTCIILPTVTIKYGQSLSSSCCCSYLIPTFLLENIRHFYPFQAISGLHRPRHQATSPGRSVHCGTCRASSRSVERSGS